MGVFTEDKIVDYFDFIKEYYNNYNIVFLSERFLKIYNLLSEKYSNIKLNNVFLFNDDTFTLKRNIYVDDLNLSLPEGIKIYDKVITFLDVNDFKDTSISFVPEITAEEKEKINDTSLYKKNSIWYNQKFFSKAYDSDDALEFLLTEVMYLEKNGINDAKRLLPSFIGKYFDFYLKYRPEIAYFEKEYSKIKRKDKIIIYEDMFSILIKMKLYNNYNIDSEFIRFASDAKEKVYTIEDIYEEDSKVKKIK